mgnify:CR=1 FL=1
MIEEHPSDDNHIKKWIQIILKSLTLNQKDQSAETSNTNTGANNPRSSTMLEFEFKKILMELRDSSKYENAIQRLAKFAQNYPQYNY